MALTKISTGGVKDDAASQAKIADEAIDAARLQVSNAGTSGQFLQKQSGNTGGLTWADVPAGVGGANGVDFNDNIKARYGAGYDLSIWSDGSVGILQGISGGGIHIGDADTENIIDVEPSQVVFNKNLVSQDNDIDIRKSGASRLLWDDSDTAFEFANDVKLTFGGSAGSSGQVLTSGGASAAPSWTTISAAPEVELTADGAIGNNVACNIKSNGKVEAVTEVAAGANYVSASTGASANYVQVTYDREHKLVVVFFEQSNELRCVVGTPSGEGSTSTFTWGSVQTIHSSDSAYKYLAAEYIYFNDTNKHVISYFDGSSRPFNLRVIVVDIAADGTASTGGPTTVQASGNADGTLTAERGEICNGHETNYPYLLFYIKSSSDQLQWRDGTVNTANNTTTASGGGNCCGPGNNRLRDSMYCFSYLDNSRNTIMVKNASTTWYYNTRIAGSWRTYATFGTDVSRLNMFYDTTAGKIFAFYIESSTGDLRYKTGTPDTASSGGGITSWSSASTIRTDVSGWYGNHSIVTYDTKNSKYWLMLSEDVPAQKTFMWGFTIASNAAITWDGSMKEIQAGQRQVQHVFYETSLGNPIATSNKEIWTSYGASSTMDTTNFLGWSSAAASDGATAKVKVVGNTVTGLSGLTPGKKYYVQRDGSVSLTPVSGISVEAGLALTSTSLLIK